VVDCMHGSGELIACLVLYIYVSISGVLASRCCNETDREVFDSPI